MARISDEELVPSMVNDSPNFIAYILGDQGLTERSSDVGSDGEPDKIDIGGVACLRLETLDGSCNSFSDCDELI